MTSTMRNVIVAVAFLIVVQLMVGALSADAYGPPYQQGAASPLYLPVNGMDAYQYGRAGYAQSYYPVTVEVPVSSQCYFQQTFCTTAGCCRYPVVSYWWEYPLISTCCNTGR